MVDSRSGWCGGAGAAAAVAVAVAADSLVALRLAARLTARAASMVPSPAPGAFVRAGVTLSASTWLTWAPVRCGNRDKMSAATPDTMPLDMLVELIGA